MGATIVRTAAPRMVSRPFLTLQANVAVMVAAANGTRHEIEIHSRSSNGNGANAQIRIGDSSVGLLAGRPMLNGETLRYRTRDAVFAWTGANGQIICVTEFIT